ncbi:MAG: Transcriptional activator spt7 [Sclerophora amabilis]|nr:MAG: Transcriptional activator spt7 [Sclerophora amabilis]
MSFANHHQPLRPPESSNGAPHCLTNNGGLPRPRIPYTAVDGVRVQEKGSIMDDGDIGGEKGTRVAAFKENFLQSEAKIAGLFAGDGGDSSGFDRSHDRQDDGNSTVHGDAPEPQPLTTPKRPARKIDEDDYDDDDEDDDDGEDDDGIDDSSPLKAKSLAQVALGRTSTASPVKPPSLPSKPIVDTAKATSAEEQSKTSEEFRKKLEHDKKAAEDAAKRSFHTLFYTLENDRDAMLEQQKLEELDRQVEAEISGSAAGNSATNTTSVANEGQGKLSSANLGASSLTLKHLIARIDAKREQVRASDAELRTLMSEVRKNRSKWANPERVGQEELYEAAEKVLSELKAMTEHSTAFLSRVNKREAPDYHNIIKHPMDLGSMTKKLKSISYKSKQDFVDDINLIWANCLKYNADPSHYLRKHALAMRKETDKLVPLIPDIVIRDRAEVEAEERRMQNGDADGDADGGEESDDEPIMSSRGRKAPSKKAKKGVVTARKTPDGQGDGTPGPEAKPLTRVLSSRDSNNNMKDSFRAGSDAPVDPVLNGLSTPPPGGPGTFTPAMANGILGSLPPGSQSDAVEVDGFGPSINGIRASQGPPGPEDVELEDLEYKTWKQVTKKDRALVAAERNRLFKGDQLNAEEPALLRTKAAMRRWHRKQRQADADGATGDHKMRLEGKEGEEAAQSGETLAEGMEGEDERVLPDYYDTLAAIPEIAERLRWVEDAEGQLVDQSEEFLRMMPKGHFTAPESSLTQKIHGNMRQMQETRKICSKIGVIKQMQLQSQMYQNQFQKYNPEPFVEADIPAHVVSDEGPVMSPWVVRAALQRSVGKIFYHAGFEEFQPSALDTATDMAGQFFNNLVQTLGVYREDAKVPETAPVNAPADIDTGCKQRFTVEECILHCLHENGLDVGSLESYCTEDIERQGSKLGVMHERMRAHLADLLRPALNDAGPDGSNAFNDGSEQFVGGDFAEDLNEDFFGFHELGLDKEFGLSSLSVPLHLLQNRMHNAYQAQNTNANISSTSNLDVLPPYEPITLQNLKSQIGLVQNFFLAKLHANSDEPLIEDEDLPQKQRLPKPKLPATGKISSPRKRPLKEQQGGNKAKKRKVEGPGGGGGAREDGGPEGKSGHGGGPVGGGGGTVASSGINAKPVGKLKLSTIPSNGVGGLDGEIDGLPVGGEKGVSMREGEKDEPAESGVGMISPESIVAT